MLHRLHLINFKKHADLDVSFTSGLNVIMGPNYRGKSSILHGVLYALWGATAVPCNADKIPRTGSSTFEVELWFDLGSSAVYYIRRTKTKDELQCDGKLIATGKAAVAKELEKLLGMSQAQFLRLLYAEQKKAENLVSLGAAELNRTIEEVAGTSVVRDAITKLIAIMRTSQAAADAVKLVRGERPGDEEKASLEATCAQAEREVEQETALVTVEKQKLASLTEAREALRRNARLYQERSERAAQLKTAVANAAREAEQAAPCTIEQLDAARAAADKARQRVSRLAESYRKAQADLAAWTRWEQERKALEAQQAEALAPEDAPFARIDENELAAAMQERQRTSEKAALARAEVDRLAAAAKSGICGACKRPLEGHDPEKLATEQRAAEAALTKAANAAEQARVAAVALEGKSMRYGAWERETEKRIAHLKALDEKRALLESQRVAAVTEDLLTTLKGEGREAASRRDDAEAALRALEQAAQQAADRAGRLATLQEQLASAEAALAEMTFDSKELEQAELAVAAVTETLEAASFRANHATERLHQAKTALTQHAMRVNAWETANQQLEQHEARHGRAKKLRAFLQENFDTFMAETWEGLLAMASHLTRLGTEGYISEVLRSDDGKFEYIEEGERFTVMGSGSGAQRSLMGLSMQVAMSEMLPCPLLTLMMDEASADMDAEVSAALVTALKSLGKQVILVSHRELDALVADNVIALE